MNKQSNSIVCRQTVGEVDIKRPKLLPILVNRELHTPLSQKSCKHLDIDLNNTNITYETGDHLGVMPTNDELTVEMFARHLRVDPDDTFSFPTAPKSPTTPNLPEVCSVRTALAKYCDLNAIVKRPVLDMCATWATDPIEKDRLAEMGSSSDRGKV
jgi:NADPH-ferrihemoprotein reductase